MRYICLPWSAAVLDQALPKQTRTSEANANCRSRHRTKLDRQPLTDSHSIRQSEMQSQEGELMLATTRRLALRNSSQAVACSSTHSIDTQLGHDNSDLRTQGQAKQWCSVGETRSTSLTQNRISMGAFVSRRVTRCVEPSQLLYGQFDHRVRAKDHPFKKNTQVRLRVGRLARFGSTYCYVELFAAEYLDMHSTIAARKIQSASGAPVKKT